MGRRHSRSHGDAQGDRDVSRHRGNSAKQGQPRAGVPHVEGSRSRSTRCIDSPPIIVESQGMIGRITLNRPHRRNAFDRMMVTELQQAFEAVTQVPALRGIVLGAAGSVFCAGADIQWMQAESPVSESQATEDAHQLTCMLHAVDECPCPVIARVQGLRLRRRTRPAGSLRYRRSRDGYDLLP